MKVSTKRQEIGALIAELRAEMNMTRHTLGDKTRNSVANVERWEAGSLCPSSSEWSRITAVWTKLHAAKYKDLYRQAAIEQGAEIQGLSQDNVDRAPDLDAAIQLVLDAVPSLRSLTVNVDDEGEIQVSYRTREVRIVEDTGTLALRRRAT